MGLYDFTGLDNSIMKGMSNIYGAIGEVVVYDYYRLKGRRVERVTDEQAWNYDLKIDGKRVDIKTKRTTVSPDEHFNCTVAASNIRQETDFYLFVRVTEDKRLAYLIGLLSKDEFLEKAEFRKIGEDDGEGWQYKADCYNVKAKDLIKIR